VIIIEHAYLGRIGKITAGSGSEKIFLSPALKESRCFPGHRRCQTVIVNAEFSCNTGIIICQCCAYQLEVRTFKEYIGFPGFLVCMQCEIAGIHLQGLIYFMNVGVRPFQSVRLHDAEELTDLTGHDLQPHNILTGLLTVKEMRTIHTVGGMKRAVQIVGSGRDDQPAVFPVVKIPGGIESYVPMPDMILSSGLFFVLTKPIIESCLLIIKDRETMSLDRFSVRVKPVLARLKGIITH